MKRSIRLVLILALVAIMTVVGAGIAMAASSQIEIKGTISAIDTVATPPTVTITPNKEGSPVILKVADTTVITKAGLGKTTIDKLAAGDRVEATYDKDSMVAAKINASNPLKDYSEFVGTVKSVASDSLVVTAKKQGDVTIAVNAETKYKVPGVKDATLAAFKAGDKVAALTVAANGGNLALHLVLVPSKPAFVARTGTIEAYVEGASITVKGLKGDISTFAITSDTKVKLEKGLTTITKGQRVIVSARRDPATDQYTAKQIHVFGAKKK